MDQKSALDIAREDVLKLAHDVTETAVRAYALPRTLRLYNAEKEIEKLNALIIALLKVMELQCGVAKTATLASALRKYNAEKEAEREIEKRRKGGLKRHEPDAKIKLEIINRWWAMPDDKRALYGAKARFAEKMIEEHGFPQNSKTIYPWIKCR